MKTRKALFFTLAMISSCVLADDYTAPPGEVAVKSKGAVGNVLTEIGFETKCTPGQLSEFKKTYYGIIKEVSIDSEISGEDQPKKFYKKLEEFVFSKNNVFPIEDIMEDVLADLHISNGCKEDIYGQLDGGKNKILQIKAVNEISSILYKKSQLAMSDRKRSERLLKYSIAFSMSTDFSFYVGGEFLSMQAGSSTGSKQVDSSRFKGVNNLFNQAMLDHTKFLKEYNLFQENIDLYLRNDTKAFTGSRPSILNLSKSVSSIEARLLHPDEKVGVSMEWRCIRLLWLMRSYARMSTNKDVLDLASKTLVNISQKSPRSFVRRWAGEALDDKNEVNNMPKRVWPGKLLRQKSNGDFDMDMNGDGKILIPYSQKDFDF